MLNLPLNQQRLYVQRAFHSSTSELSFYRTHVPTLSFPSEKFRLLYLGSTLRRVSYKTIPSLPGYRDAPKPLFSTQNYYNTTITFPSIRKVIAKMPNGKKKTEYNDFLEGEKLKDNALPRTSLQDTGSLRPMQEDGGDGSIALAPSSATNLSTSNLKSARSVSPPPLHRSPKRTKSGKGKGGKGGAKKPPLTHFLCLPLVNSSSEKQLASSLEKFKQEVTSQDGKEKNTYVPEKAIRPVGTLHLTLGVMSLDEEGMGKVGQAVAELDLSNLLSGGANATPISTSPDESKPIQPLSLSISGLRSMQHAKSTSVLYAEPRDPDNRLEPLANALRDHFTEKGLLVPDNRPLKLHATIVNTIYAKAKGRGGRQAEQSVAAKGTGTAAVGDENANDTEGEITEGEAGHEIIHELDTVDTSAPDVQEVSEEEAKDINTALEAAEDLGMKGAKEKMASATESQAHPTQSETQANQTLSSFPSSAKAKKPNRRGKGSGFIRLDARKIVEQYKDYVWAEGVKVDTVQVCKMGARKAVDEEGRETGEMYEVVFEKVF
ncbi:hypothetical protein GQ43DRAFT_440007 [Delitschia confertaspora ATCC 74209]|uniref:A-kinase anchor protein 7-like phosphoesterase domain-containing protein n=1 Tax=Delitschia confertaspora ATCC 74209 TaxID=1513339 RepID=A0A9P4MQQ1_9PLEO|nr:hypothetical protein GQ43DRAFT_440007 [Delitschia confertaspora ATCC 74209]